jgi:undecaprenyl-diphosphatase
VRLRNGVTTSTTEIGAPSTRLIASQCRWILATLLAAGFCLHLRYLTAHCPIDLAGDEAQYWDWSRRLDLSYYSKGPLVAYLIRASCAIFGQTMPAVRLPALVLAVGTSIITYLLTLRLFHSDRLALGAVLLNHLVPLFIAGSMLMTIDAPLFFCWALATLLGCIAILEKRTALWPWIGLVVGIGALAKYAMLLWLPIVIAFLYFDPLSRPVLRTRGPYLACLIALLCMTPVAAWNARHGWVGLRHVANDVGPSGGVLANGGELLLISSQLGLIGPPLVVLMIAAIADAFRNRARNRSEFLLAFVGVGFWAIVAVDSLIARVQPNWPAPAYFTLIILTARFIARQIVSAAKWRRWRGWVYATVVLGVAFVSITPDPGFLLPALAGVVRDPGRFDPLSRLRGWQTLGDFVSDKLAALPPGAFVMCDDYQQTAEMAFYVRGQPSTYCAGPYTVGKRLSQYDMWPDRRLDRSSPLVGNDAVYLGKGGDLPPPLIAAFDRIDPRLDLDITCHGVKTHTFRVYLCHRFKGFDALAQLNRSESY